MLRVFAFYTRFPILNVGFHEFRGFDYHFMLFVLNIVIVVSDYFIRYINTNYCLVIYEYYD